jgi:hypothetical protein
MFSLGNEHDRSHQANNQHCLLAGASHSLALGVLPGAMQPVRMVVLQTMGWFCLASRLASSDMLSEARARTLRVMLVTIYKTTQHYNLEYYK